MHLQQAVTTALIGLLLAFVATPSRADEAADRAAAEALYELGQALLEKGNVAEACPKLEASNALDPGVGTLLLLGDCQEKAGKLASAWATFKEAAALARAHDDPSRTSIAELRATALRPRLTFVVFRVSAQNELDGFELRRGSSLVARGSYGVSLPMDTGRYELVAAAPNHETWRGVLEVPSKLDEPLVVTVPPLRSTAAALRLTPAVLPPATPPVPPPEPARDTPSSTGGAQRTLGLVSFGVGAAAAIAAGVLTYSAAKKNHDSKSECRESDPNLCNPSGVSARDSAQSLATVATVLGIGGAVFAGTGLVLFLTAPSTTGKQAGFVAGLDGRF